MTTKEMAGAGYYSFEGTFSFDGEQLIEKVLTIMEREDRAEEKIISYGLCGITGLYLSGSIIRALF